MKKLNLFQQFNFNAWHKSVVVLEMDTPSKTTIGQNGITFLTDKKNKYFYLNTDNFVVQMGDYGFKITDSGIYTRKGSGSTTWTKFAVNRPYVGRDGKWWVDGYNTGKTAPALGANVKQPYIGDDGIWYVYESVYATLGVSTGVYAYL